MIKRTNNITFDLQLFADSDFFRMAFEEMYTPEENDNNKEHTEETDNTDIPSEGVGEPESNPTTSIDEIPVVENNTPKKPVEEVIDTSLTREEMLEAIKATQQQPEVNEETKQALELMQFLKDNPHLVQAMQSVDPQGYQTLNQHVPDEVTKKMQELEEFMVEQKYQSLVNTMKSKYADYDEDKVLNFADENGISDLEIAYKALKADELSNQPTPSVDEVKAQLEKELRAKIMEELKQDALNTQSIVSQSGATPPVQKEVVLTQHENKVALALGIEPDEYAKWRDSK